MYNKLYLCVYRSLDQVAPYRSHLWSVNKARRSAPFLSSSLPKGSSGNLMQLALTNQPSFASHVVTVSDVSHLLPLSYDLARMYRWERMVYKCVYCITCLSKLLLARHLSFSLPLSLPVVCQVQTYLSYVLGMRQLQHCWTGRTWCGPGPSLPW